ncbi:uncharacterized protein LOC125029857 [Penaeus chinensis]|uniref:uncharacterized protein LOC125029857 n=1 Tax=Penaeus chinensis TaxID=139456 RepID=UPI001FB7893D|nr:uncharacterized protein LOC125029857 [Penaeus chinensis]
MTSLSELMKFGKELGLTGENLQEFVREEQSKERERFELEREERAKEREARKVELEMEPRVKELELERLRLQVQSDESEKYEVKAEVFKPALPKLPVFNEANDSIDAYILRFERLATSAGWDRDVWAVSLASLLQGKALETYQHLSPMEARDFERVKDALLRCFQCTAEGYRQRLRCDQTYVDVFDLMLTEQFLNACDKCMVLFLKEHDFKTFNEMIKYAELYMDATGHASASANSSSASGVNRGEERMKGGARACFVCGRGNHLAKDCYNRVGGTKYKDSKIIKSNAEKAAMANHGDKLMIARGNVEGVNVDVFRDPGYPIYELVIGTIEGSTDGGMSVQVSAVTTRLQKKEEEKCVRGQSKLKVKDVLKNLKNKHIGKLQREDKTLDKIREYAESKRVFSGKSEGETHSFVVKRGALYRRVQRTQQVTEQLVVPESFRDAVIGLAHDSLMGGHLGIKKTTARIQSNFFWPGMGVEITRYCRSCDVCQRTVDKGRVSRVKMGRVPLIQEPFQRVAVDIVGPIEPRANDGSRYMLTIVDYATRYPEAIALKNIDTCTVAEALLSVFSRVGIPKEVMSDRGSQFTSEMMREFNRLLSIRSLTTTPYHAMSNGLVERFNGVLKKMLKRMCQEQPKMWPRFIDPLLFSYREVPQTSTKFSPFELVYGHSVRGPLALLRELWEGDREAIEDDTRTTYEYVVNLRERLQETCKLAQEELEKAGDSYQYYYDKRAREREVNVGDKVILLLPTSHNKLLLQWQGPFKVIKKANRYNYVLDVNGTERKYHINMIKRYHERFVKEGDSKPNKDVERSDATCDVKVMRDVISGKSNVDENSEQENGDDSVLACVAVVCEDHDEGGEVITVPSYVQEEDVSNVRVNEELSADQKRDVANVLSEFSAVFTDVPGRTDVIEHTVNLTSDRPVNTKPYPIPYALQQNIADEVDRMLELDVIEPSTSPYSNPLIAVKKKDGSDRVCLDSRKINKLTVFDSEPMPDQDLMMTRISGSRYFTKIDLSRGYWQIPIDEQSKPITAFQTNKGLMQFKVVPFGLINASATFNRMMRKLFNDTANVEMFVDDLLVHTKGWKEHIETLIKVLNILANASLTARPSKTEIGYFTIEYLGSDVGGEMTQTTADKVNKIMDMAVPKTKRQIRSFLGLTGYYRHYIPDYATIAAPLYELIKKSQPNNVRWEICHEDAFNKLKEALSTRPILKLPDMSKDFVLQVDASEVGLGAVLLQYQDGQRWPVLYASKKLKGAERNYSVIEKECLAVVWAVSKFYQYLYGKAFVIESDHQPLKYLNSANHLNGRLMRWSMYMQQFNYTVKNIAGRENVVHHNSLTAWFRQYPKNFVPFIAIEHVWAATDRHMPRENPHRLFGVIQDAFHPWKQLHAD